jgi:hypothetical protein
MAFRAVVIAGLSALLTDICVGIGTGVGFGVDFADFTGVASGTTMGENLIVFALVFVEPSGTKLSLFFSNSFS